MAGYNTEKRRRPQVGGKFIVIAVLLMLVVVFVGLCAFLRVSEIVIEGAELYAPEEIEAAAGIEKGDSLLLVSSSRTALAICRKFPYVENVRIKREIPGRVVITVTESSAVAFIEADGAYWKLDQNCRLLERTDAKGVAGLIRIVGATPISPSEGKSLSLGLEEESKEVYIKSLLAGACAHGIADKIGRLDAENIARLGFTYGDNLTVFFGSGAEIDAKFSMLMRILQDCADQYGTIDVSDPDEGHFIPA